MTELETRLWQITHFIIYNTDCWGHRHTDTAWPAIVTGTAIIWEFGMVNTFVDLEMQRRQR